MTHRRTVLFGLLFGVIACNAILGIEDRLPRPDDSTLDGATNDGEAGPDDGSTSNADGASDAPLLDVVQGDGGEMAVVIAGSGGFAIDRYEVTVAEYAEFRTKAATFDAGGLVCGWNTTYEPSCTPSPLPNAPMTCIDWCDAYAYCLWRGKRLCGRIGGGASKIADFPDAASDEWTRACAGGLDSNRFAYGVTGDVAKCNVQGTPNSTGVFAVGSLAACVGATPNVYDLSGNAWEWESSCLDSGGAPNNDGCTFRGGCYANPLADSKCSVGTFLPRDVGSTFVGFRCCKSL